MRRKTLQPVSERKRMKSQAERRPDDLALASFRRSLSEIEGIEPPFDVQTSEGYLDECERLERECGPEIARLCTASARKMMDFQSIHRLDPESEEFEAAISRNWQKGIDANLVFIRQEQAGETPHDPNFFEVLDEVGRLHLDDIQDFCAALDVDGLPEEYRPWVKANLAKIQLLFAKLQDMSLLRHAHRKNSGTKDGLRAVQLLIRQEAFPIFEMLAKMDTEKLGPVFESIKSETVDYLVNAFPELERGSLEARAANMSFTIESVTNWRDWEGVGGRYLATDRQVVIPRKNRHREEVYIHEILHGLSRSEKSETGRLHFSDSELDSDTARLLTEAVIEEIMQFTQVGEATTEESYAAERRLLLNSLRRYMNWDPKNEIPLAVFVKALFSEDKKLRDSLTEAGFGRAADDILKFANTLGRKIQEDRRAAAGRTS